MMIKLISAIIVFMFLVTSCKKDDVTPPATQYLQVDVIPTYTNGGAMKMNLDSVYTTPEGYQVKFTDVKFYTSTLKNESINLLQSSLFDYRETGGIMLRTSGDYTKFANLQGFIGVDSVLNHSDPSAFPNESPLNISNAGPMHWGWNPGYIFMNIEGKVDTIPDGINNLDHSFSFHIGTDLYRRDFSFTNLNWLKISDSERKLNLKLDLWKFLHNPISSIDLKSEFLTHTASGQQPLTEKVISNFQQSLQPY
jgi:hypothetical protein